MAHSELYNITPKKKNVTPLGTDSLAPLAKALLLRVKNRGLRKNVVRITIIPVIPILPSIFPVHRYCGPYIHVYYMCAFIIHKIENMSYRNSYFGDI